MGVDYQLYIFKGFYFNFNDMDNKGFIGEVKKFLRLCANLAEIMSIEEFLWTCPYAGSDNSEYLMYPVKMVKTKYIGKNMGGKSTFCKYKDYSEKKFMSHKKKFLDRLEEEFICIFDEIIGEDDKNDKNDKLYDLMNYSGSYYSHYKPNNENKCICNLYNNDKFIFCRNKKYSICKNCKNIFIDGIVKLEKFIDQFKDSDNSRYEMLCGTIHAQLLG
jgi:hypothetical protein